MPTDQRGCGAPWPEFVVAVQAIRRLGAAAVLIGPASKQTRSRTRWRIRTGVAA
ncbi:hypothetical protein AB0346_15410 [Nocardia beijingensis]|uniref:hypothetical protein n=1 Tax=Nocardia beijingensis TaxID=95162 RepID=UPI00344FCEA9